MIRKIFGVLLLASTAFAFGACQKDNNEKPTPKPAPETHTGEEAEPVRAELTLAGGHFHGVAFHQDADAKGITYKKAVQHLTFVRKGDAWELEKGSAEAFRVLSSTQYLYPYGLWIKYYDAKGQDITATIAANGESRTHQHFFVPSDVKPTFDGKAENDDQIADSLLNYVYMDTNPTDGILKSTTDKATGKTIPAAKLVGSKVTGQNALGNIFEPLNPIGMKGFFQFKKPRKSFVLTVTLFHFDGDAPAANLRPSSLPRPDSWPPVTAKWCSACRLWSTPRAKRRANGKPLTQCPTRNSARPNNAWCFPPLAPTASPKNWPRPTGSPTFSAKWTRRAARSGSDFRRTEGLFVRPLRGASPYRTRFA